MSYGIFAAGIQKWVDESGQIHYGDTPPPKVITEPIQVTRPPSNPGKPLPRLNGNKSGEETAQQQTQQNNNAPELSQDQAKEACQQAQSDLSTLNKSSRLRLRSADGTERYMSPEEISERRALSEKDIDLYCK